jgi:hypothetical protein
VAISFHLHGELDIPVDTVKVVKEFCHLAESMWPDDKRSVYIAKSAKGLVGHHLQSHFFKVLHEIFSNDWGKQQTHRHTVCLLVHLAIENEERTCQHVAEELQGHLIEVLG